MKRGTKLNKSYKNWWLLIILIAVIIGGIILLNYKHNRIMSKNDCDKSILFEKDKSYINEVRFEEDGIVLIGSYIPSELYNEDMSVAQSKQINPKIKLGQELVIYLTEECNSRFKLINFSRNKATFEHDEGCAPPGPSSEKKCTFEVFN